MSTERLSFNFNSLIPETYKTKAEAFARCLQHKLLSLGRIESSSDSYNGGTRRLSCESQLESKQTQAVNASEWRMEPEEVTRIPEKTDDFDEEFCSHSGSENGDLTEKKEEGGRTKQTLTSMSSEDSTVDSWSSCQENLTDFEKFDSENEDASTLAAQIRGSPKLRNFNIRTKRKEIREKSWKRNSRKNHSPSTESKDAEEMKQTQNRQGEHFDAESTPPYILLDGLESESDEASHRILRESLLTSNLEKHFSRQEDSATDFPTSRRKLEKKVSEESSLELLTPPPSPDLEKRTQEERSDVNNRLNFAQVETDFEGVDFVEADNMKDLNLEGMFKSVRKIGGVIVECSNDAPIDKNSETSLDTPENFVVTCSLVEVLHDGSEQQPNAEEAAEQTNKPIGASEDDEMLNTHSRMRRCSSLKTWKTPPGTPGRKKIVRFADALGLDLADVRTFLDEIPKIPSSAYEDLHFDFPKTEDHAPSPPTPTLIPLFQQPGNSIDFIGKVQHQKICLESTLITDEGVLTVTGFIRVQNMSFQKSVHVRYTLNNWETFSDLQATYVPNSSDGFSDRFSFVLYGHTLKVGQKLEFALRLECCGAQYWDNNGGANYVLNCAPQSLTSGFFSSLCNTQVDPRFDFY